jgi:hypothetical protein
MKKLIPLCAIAAGLVLTGCKQSYENSSSSTNATPATETSPAGSMTNSSETNTNLPPSAETISNTPTPP